MFCLAKITKWEGLTEYARVKDSVNGTDFLLNGNRIAGMMARGSKSILYYIDNLGNPKEIASYMECENSIAELTAQLDQEFDSMVVDVNRYIDNDPSKATVEVQINVNSLIYGQSYSPDPTKTYLYYTEGKRAQSILVSSSLQEIYDSVSLSSYWTTHFISAVIENAASSNIVVTFGLAKGLTAADFTVTVNGVARAINSATWNDKVLTLVLASPVVFGDIVVLTFKTGQTADVDNYVGTALIDTHRWATENANVTTTILGTAIPVVTNNLTWEGAKIAYDNAIAGGATVYDATKAAAMCRNSAYGKFYNYWAIALINYDIIKYNFANGNKYKFKVPTFYSASDIIASLGGTGLAGGKLKEQGTSHWQTPNTGATNESGFTALPAGLLQQSGTLSLANQYAMFGLLKYDTAVNYYRFYCDYNTDDAAQNLVDKRFGMNLRMVEASPLQKTAQLAYRFEDVHIVAQKGDKVLAFEFNTLYLSSNGGKTYPVSKSIAPISLLSFGHIFDNGNILFADDTKCYLSTDNLATYAETTVLATDGTPFVPGATLNNFRAFIPCNVKIGATEMLAWGNYVIDGGAERNIWYTTDNGVTIKSAYKFGTEISSGVIINCRHIHAVDYNPYDNSFWIQTGDQVDECHWIKATFNNNTWSFTVIASGNALSYFKTTGMHFTATHVFFGCDSSDAAKKGIWKAVYSDITNTALYEQVYVSDKEIGALKGNGTRIIAAPVKEAAIVSTNDLVTFTKTPIIGGERLDSGSGAYVVLRDKNTEGYYLFDVFTDYETLNDYTKGQVLLAKVL